VLEDPELRQGIKSFTAWPTIPQVFVAGEFVVRCLFARRHEPPL
jgi:glutaredoxin-related protein